MLIKDISVSQILSKGKPLSHYFLESSQQKPARPASAAQPNASNFDRDRDASERMNPRDNPPAEHDDLLAVLACPTADYNDLSLLIYRYGRDMDWK